MIAIAAKNIALNGAESINVPAPSEGMKMARKQMRAPETSVASAGLPRGRRRRKQIAMDPSINAVPSKPIEASTIAG